MRNPLDPAVSPRLTGARMNFLTLKMEAPPAKRGRSFEQTMKTEQLVVIRLY